MNSKPTFSARSAATGAAVCSAMMIVLALAISAQTNGAAAIGDGAAGTAIFDSLAGVALRTMKEPGRTVGMGPKRLDFSGVRVNTSALNVVEITNGTNSKIQIESLSLPSTGFRVAGALGLPLIIPPQTQALLKIEFLPARAGDYGGDVQAVYRSTGGGKQRKMRIALKGKGVPE